MSNVSILRPRDHGHLQASFKESNEKFKRQESIFSHMQFFEFFIKKSYKYAQIHVIKSIQNMTFLAFIRTVTIIMQSEES